MNGRFGLACVLVHVFDLGRTCKILDCKPLLARNRLLVRRYSKFVSSCGCGRYGWVLAKVKHWCGEGDLLLFMGQGFMDPLSWLRRLHEERWRLVEVHEEIVDFLLCFVGVCRNV